MTKKLDFEFDAWFEALNLNQCSEQERMVGIAVISTIATHSVEASEICCHYSSAELMKLWVVPFALHAANQRASVQWLVFSTLEEGQRSDSLGGTLAKQN